MANIDLGWEVKGSIQADESVTGMLKVIEEKDETGSFWCWDGRVSIANFWQLRVLTIVADSFYLATSLVKRRMSLIYHTYFILQTRYMVDTTTYQELHGEDDPS